VANYLRAETALRAGAAHLRAVIGQEHRAEAALAAAQRAVAAAKVVVAQDQHKADEGLRVIDENGSVSFLSVLLGAHNFGDFLTRLSMLQKIWSMEMGFLGQARLAEAHLAVLERQQQADLNRIAALRRQAVAQVVALQAQDQRAVQARAAENVAVQDAQDAVAGLVSQRNGLLAKIRAILAALDSGNASWPQVLKLIDQLAGAYGISPALVEAVVLQESGGYSGAKSSAGAMGLMQLMPSTAAALGVSNAYDPVQNLKGGITYLLEMLQRFHGNVALALAAYNAGPGAVEKYGGVPPYQQTQRYVRNIMAMVAQGR
jgi:soluble lytic murein transglycosylase-like protein